MLLQLSLILSRISAFLIKASVNYGFWGYEKCSSAFITALLHWKGREHTRTHIWSTHAVKQAIYGLLMCNFIVNLHITSVATMAYKHGPKRVSRISPLSDGTIYTGKENKTEKRIMFFVVVVEWGFLMCGCMFPDSSGTRNSPQNEWLKKVMSCHVKGLMEL